MADESDEEKQDEDEPVGDEEQDNGEASSDADASADDEEPAPEADDDVEDADDSAEEGDLPEDEGPVPEVSEAAEETPDEEKDEQEVVEETDETVGEEFEESVVHVNRCCKVVQGGKQFSFSALVVAGNRDGKISYGFGKANQVPQAIQKAIQDSRKRIIEVPIVHGTTPHRVELEYCSTKLMLRPASPGTGVIAALPVRTTVNLAGITDLLTKVYGSTNPINCVKAVYEGLKSLRTKEEIEDLRGVKIT